MTRLAIRGTIVAGILAALVLALLYTPDGSPLSTWDREGYHGLLLTLWGLVGAAVALVVGSIAMHRVTDLLGALGIWTPHDWMIMEAEARGEAPA